MLEPCMERLIHFSDSHVYAPIDSSRFYLEEKSPLGSGKAYFQSNSACIVLKAGTSGPLLWSLKNKKIAEGAILTSDDEGYHLHLVEMKSKLTQGEWAKVISQFEGMYLTSLATVRILDVLILASVTCYIAYKQDAMAANQSADMIFMKTFVGQPNPVGGVDSWTTNTVALPFREHARLVKAARDINNDADFGIIRS